MAFPHSRYFRKDLGQFKRSSVIALALVAAMFATGADAKRRASTAAGIAGNTIHGFESDGEYYDYYAPDGSASSMLNGGDVTHGRWWMQGGSLCTSFPGDSTTCYAMQLNGNQSVLTDPNGSVFQGEILRGNPKGI